MGECIEMFDYNCAQQITEPVFAELTAEALDRACDVVFGHEHAACYEECEAEAYAVLTRGGHLTIAARRINPDTNVSEVFLFTGNGPMGFQFYDGYKTVLMGKFAVEISKGEVHTFENQFIPLQQTEDGTYVPDLNELAARHQLNEML